MFNFSYFNRPLELDTSNVEIMSRMFANSQFNSKLGLSSFANVTNMMYMFSSCAFNHSLSLTNTSKVKSLEGMFMNVRDFNSSRWDLLRTCLKGQALLIKV